MPHSTILQLLIDLGGGTIRPNRRGGYGIYSRLEGNALYTAPLALTVARGKDGNEYLYPAAFVDAPYWLTGFDLVPIQDIETCKRLLPELAGVTRVAYVQSKLRQFPRPQAPHLA